MFNLLFKSGQISGEMTICGPLGGGALPQPPICFGPELMDMNYLTEFLLSRLLEKNYFFYVGRGCQECPDGIGDYSLILTRRSKIGTRKKEVGQAWRHVTNDNSTRPLCPCCDMVENIQQIFF